MDKQNLNNYKVIKIRLYRIIKDSESLQILSDAVNRTHQIVIHVYQFLRLWILNKYENNVVIPKITEDILKMSFRALTEHTNGPNPKGDNLKIYEEFKTFNEEVYSKLNYTSKIKSINLSAIIDYQCTDMLTNIENNIEMHFIDYLKQYVNGHFKDEHMSILEKYEGKEKILLRKSLRKELKDVKEDLLNNTLNSNPNYHTWINENRPKIYPTNVTQLVRSELNADPQIYLKGMIFMNIKLEEIGKKMFQFFPLRSNGVPKYATFDTKSIIELLIKSNKQEYLVDIENNKKTIWEKYFNMNNPIFKYKNYHFDYMIRTDGYAVSIQFIHEEQYIKKKEKNEKMKKARQEANMLYSKLKAEYEADLIFQFWEKIKLGHVDKNEVNIIKKEYENISIKASEEAYLRISEIRKEKKKKVKEKEDANRKAIREKNKDLSKEEKKKIVDSMKKRKEFPYLEDLSIDELKEIRESFIIYVDPGKKSLLTMMGDDNRIFKYTNSRRIKETKRLKHQRLLHNYRRKKGILEYEEILSKYNSKSCNYNKFKEYVEVKNRLNGKLLEKYEDTRFRQYKWHAYINTKRSESKMLDSIEEFFGIKNGMKDNKKVVILYGDWGIPKQLRHFMSTPMIGLKRIVNERFTIYDIDEFRTSCLDYQTETKCDNLYSPDKKGTIRKIHSVLTFKMKDKRMGCRNRDVNSVMNMKKITDYWFINGKRPLKYTRSYAFEEEKTGRNPSSTEIEVPNLSKPVKDEQTTQGAITVLKMKPLRKSQPRKLKSIIQSNDTVKIISDNTKIKAEKDSNDEIKENLSSNKIKTITTTTTKIKTRKLKLNISKNGNKIKNSGVLSTRSVQG